MKNTPFRYAKWLFLVILLAALLLLNLSIGSVSIPAITIFKTLMGVPSENDVWNTIILDFRLTKSLTCLLAGSALSIAGLQMQTLFRNPLAGPDVLGLSSGASLAVSLVLMATSAGLGLIPAGWSIALAAAIGASCTLLLVLAVASRVQDNTSILLIGLMIGAGTASLVSVLQFMSRAEDQQYYLIWTFGSLGGLDWGELSLLGIGLLIGFTVAVFNLKSMNAWLLGVNYARSLGINPSLSRFLMILSASVLTGFVTAFCGPIAFVGLAVPHLVKLVVKTSDHKTLLPAVAIGGPSLLLLCDTIAQLPGSGFVLPINAVTALVGAPVVIWVIIKGKKVYA
jgi:iron complex transport system permease protein